VGKDLAAKRIQAEVGRSVTLLAIGDDRTDADLFRGLPADAITIGVGPTVPGARFRVDDHRAVRRLLTSMLDERDVSGERYSREARLA